MSVILREEFPITVHHKNRLERLGFRGDFEGDVVSDVESVAARGFEPEIRVGNPAAAVIHLVDLNITLSHLLHTQSWEYFFGHLHLFTKNRGALGKNTHSAQLTELT